LPAPFVPQSWSGSVRDILVTGTDTGVGKTLIAAAIVTALRKRGVRAIGFKPAETGVTSEQDADSDVLARASGTAEPLATPLLQLAEPLAPAVAADRAGTALQPDEIEARIAALRRAGYTVVVEGAGGVLVPLTWDYTALDLGRACDLDAIVVARPGLGTLNHAAMTVMLLRAREIPVRGVVLNGRSASPDLAETTNPAALTRMLGDIRIVETPRDLSGDPVAAAAHLIDRLL
jgi:dethiobiotin synthetase